RGRLLARSRSGGRRGHPAVRPDGAHDGGRHRPLRLQPAAARGVRGHGAAAAHPDLRRAAACLAGRGARDAGFHRSAARAPGQLAARARRRPRLRRSHSRARLARVGQGRQDRRLRRHNRRAAPAGRPLRLLHDADGGAHRHRPPGPGGLSATSPHRTSGRPREGEHDMTEALVGLVLMMALALLRVPIALAMGVVGFLGVAYLRDWNFAPALAMVETKVYETGRNYTLSVVPLFILMGNLVTRAGMSQELFRAAYACIGHLRGGLAMATVCACAGFGAICGSSIATAATMAKVAYPAMKGLGYSDRLSTGAIAGGGTLGILIPPSTIMVIYGIMTGTNIGKLFAAGILPGILAIALLCLAVQYVTWRDPKAGPRGERLSWRERFATLDGVVWFVAVAAALTAAV